MDIGTGKSSPGRARLPRTRADQRARGRHWRRQRRVGRCWAGIAATGRQRHRVRKLQGLHDGRRPIRWPPAGIRDCGVAGYGSDHRHRVGPCAHRARGADAPRGSGLDALDRGTAAGAGGWANPASLLGLIGALNQGVRRGGPAPASRSLLRGRKRRLRSDLGPGLTLQRFSTAGDRLWRLAPKPATAIHGAWLTLPRRPRTGPRYHLALPNSLAEPSLSFGYSEPVFKRCRSRPSQRSRCVLYLPTNYVLRRTVFKIREYPYFGTIRGRPDAKTGLIVLLYRRGH